MQVTFLKDLNDDCIDAVILSHFSGPQEIQAAINKAKEKNEFYDFEDIINALPKDCLIFDRWTNESIYY